MTPLPANGLYAITSGSDSDALLDFAERVIAGGTTLIQYRDKESDARTLRENGERLLALCREHRVHLIINDDLELAAAIGADGIHLGREDAGLERARDRLGPEGIIGISCYNQPQLALQAQEKGADYVAFGSFFPSSTKPEAVPATLEMLQEARPQLHIPIAAIGGITPENGTALITAGANYLAVISSLSNSINPTETAHRYAHLFDLIRT